MMNRNFNLQRSKVLKTDLSNLLPPEVLDKTRATEKMVLGAILNHQDETNDQMKLVLMKLFKRKIFQFHELELYLKP